jgi:8-oxo-dGTP pyrophosphatase MutT (NUDIX family)
MRSVQKVVAYIVHDGRLVVFRHVDDLDGSQAGIQVPAGTVRAGELPEEAVIREAWEENGLDGLSVTRFLGVNEYDVRPYDNAIHVRHYFHLSLDRLPSVNRWRAAETGDGDAEPIWFDLFWLPLRQAHVIAAGQAALVGRLFDA